MNDAWGLLLLVVIWFALNRFVFPRLGIKG